VSSRRRSEGSDHESTPPEPKTLTPYQAWTDGSVRPQNPGFGAAAYVLMSEEDVWLNGWWLGNDITNNKAELQAILDCVGFSHDNQLYPLTIYSDSEWAVNCITGKYKARHNLGLIRAIQSQITAMTDVRLEWVRGHATDIFNNLVDKFANIVVRIPHHKYHAEFKKADFLNHSQTFLSEYEKLVRHV